MSSLSSFDACLSFGPCTPPPFSFELALADAAWAGHRRSSSQVSSASSFASHGSSPSAATHVTTPARSPIRQNGPLLLPKIRSQDSALENPAKRARKAPAAAPAPRRGHVRSRTAPDMAALLDSVGRANVTCTSPVTMHARSLSRDGRGGVNGRNALDALNGLNAPPALAAAGHQRRASLDAPPTAAYGLPTYRTVPTFVASATTPQAETFMPPWTFATAPREPSPMRHELSFDDFGDELGLAAPSTTLLDYLGAANPAPSLVRQLNIRLRDAGATHFWWDVRQVRPWTAFNMATVTAVPDLAALLTIALPAASLPPPAPPRTAHPETEAELHSLYAGFYCAKLNAALGLAQGSRHLAMRAAHGAGQPSFISNYTDDTSELIYGRGFGRVVGLVKSFDRWNSGMRVEGNHKKVEYLRGLAHLHKCMRDHGCRYGFILTEIELLVARNGAEGTPHFGYLEVQTIPLAAHAPDAAAAASLTTPPPDGHDRDGSCGRDGEPPMTALLALFYLHMLARDMPLPGQVGWKSEIGAPAEGTRRKCLPKDGWVPEPQLAEKREAKRARGWVWPEESVGRKELGRRGVRYGSC